jgi:hypothetical protein
MEFNCPRRKNIEIHQNIRRKETYIQSVISVKHFDAITPEPPIAQ